MFITFDGGDGTGKTTQIKLIAKWLAEKTGKEVIITKEPGGTPPAMEIRKILLEGDVNKWDFKEEIALFYVARSNHIRKLIKPALAEGKIVISDRFYDTTTAYQGHRDTDGILKTIHDIYVGDFKPELTIMMDIEPKIALQRSYQKQNQQHALLPEVEIKTMSSHDIIKNQEIRFEDMGENFHVQSRKAFLEIVEREPDRCILMDAAGTIEEVHERIVKALEKDGRISSI